jgi:hypothetical protein
MAGDRLERGCIIAFMQFTTLHKRNYAMLNSN